MPRRKRMYFSGVLFHIVQRGNNRQACFYSPDDYQYYLYLLKTALKRYAVHLHSYVLMTNHVHLLMTPSGKEGISNVMKVLGSRYAQYMNKTYQRTGTILNNPSVPFYPLSPLSERIHKIDRLNLKVYS